MSKPTEDEVTRVLDTLLRSDCVWTRHLIYHDGIEPVVYDPNSVSSSHRFVERLIERDEIVRGA